MNSFYIGLTILGIAFLGVAWLPAFLKDKLLSIPIIFIGFGVLLAYLPLGINLPNPINEYNMTLHFTEICLIVSLMGTGLKIDNPPVWSTWKYTVRVLCGTMFLGIAIITFLGYKFLGLNIVEALLLGAILSPTDPVLASDVQVGPPGKGKEDNARLILTSEAGLNDGLALPFVSLAILLAKGEQSIPEIITLWFVTDFFYKLVMGLIAGYLTGRILAFLLFYIPGKTNLPKPKDGFIVIALTFLTYGIAELLHANGFIAVFISAIAIRHFERKHELHAQMHEFSDQSERMLLVILLIFFGDLLANGLLSNLTIAQVIFAFALIFIIRPVTGMLSLIGSDMPLREKSVISFFGIRGIGSLYYLAYIMENKKLFPDIENIWSITGFIIVISVIIHGVSAGSVFQYLDKKSKKEA